MFRRSVSLKSLGIVLGLVMLGAIGIFFLHRYQINRQIGIYLQKADQAQAEKNTQKTIELLERYLMLQPQDNEEVTLRYIRLLDDSAQSRTEQARAYLALEKTLRKYPAQPELTRRAAQRAKKMNRFRDAEEHILQLIAPDAHILKVPENLEESLNRDFFNALSKCRDVDLLVLLADCETGLTHPNSAAAIRRSITNQFPDHTESYKELAQWLRQNNRLEEADKLLQGMIDKNPKSASAFLARSNFLIETKRLGDTQKAEEGLQKALTLSKNGEAGDDVLFASATLAAIGGKYPDAMNYLNQGMKDYPKQARFLIFAANLERLQGPEGRKRALSLLHQALHLVEDFSRDQWLLAKLLLDVGDKETANRLMLTLRTKYGPIPLIEYIRGRLLFGEGKLAESVAVFESIKSKPDLTKNSDLAYETNILLASAYRQMNNPERSLAAYDSALKEIPTALSALQAKADALGSLGRYSDAIELLRKVLPNLPSAKQGILRWSIAREIQKAPKERNWDDIQTLLGQFSPEEKQSPDVMLLSWEVLQATGKTQALHEAVNQACTARPKEIRFWLAKMALDENDLASDDGARTKALEQTLGAAEKQLGDRIEFRLIRARKELSVSDSGKRNLSLDKALENMDRFSTAEQAMLLSGLGELCQRFGMPDKAKDLFRKTITLAPQSWNAYLNLLNIAIEQKDDEETKKLIKTLREFEGEAGIGWRLGTIERFFSNAKLGDRSALSDTRQLINELSKLRPGWHRTASLHALLLEMEGDEISALEQYRKAIELGERKPEVVKRTVQLLMKNRNLEEAQRVLGLAMNQAGSVTAYQKLDAELTLASQQSPADALAKARATIRSDSKDYRDHLWLGQVLLASGDTRGAEAPLRQAVSLGGQDPSTWSNWIAYLVKMNRREEAAQEMKRAESVLNNQSSFASYVSIPYFEALGQRDQVEAEYRKLAANNPKDAAILQNWAAFHFRSGEINKAEEVLNSLARLPDVNPGLKRWTRRSLALALSVKGDYSSFLQAQALIKDNLSEVTLSPADLNARALILATRPGERRRAIQDLEQSFNVQKPSPNEAILLAQLYEDDGNWNKAAQVWEDLVRTKEGKTPYYSGFYIRALLRNKKIDQAAQEVTKLEANAPSDPLTIDAKVRVLLAQGQKGPAIDLLNAQTARSFSERKDPSVFVTSAQILEEAGEAAAAESYLKRFIAEVGDKKPQAILVMLSFLARQGRIGDALARCEENWTKLPPGDIATAAVSAFYYGVPKEEEFNRLETRLVELRQANPNNLRVALALADLHSHHGDLGKPKAIAIYTDLLQQKDHQLNPIVLNNLAWLLSQEPDKLNEAFELINRAIDQAGPDGSLRDTRGMILIRRGKADEAIKDIEEAVSQAPRANRYMHLALAYHHANKRAEAQQAWNKAVSLGLDFGKLPQTERSCYAELADVFKNVQ